MRAYEHSAGTLKEYKGVAEIRAYYKATFAKMSNCKDMTVPVNEATEMPRQVYFVWDCPDIGVVGATDHYLFRSGDFKIMVQVSFAVGTVRVMEVVWIGVRWRSKRSLMDGRHRDCVCVCVCVCRHT